MLGSGVSKVKIVMRPPRARKHASERRAKFEEEVDSLQSKAGIL